VSDFLGQTSTIGVFSIAFRQAATDTDLHVEPVPDGEEEECSLKPLSLLRLIEGKRSRAGSNDGNRPLEEPKGPVELL